MHFALPSRVSFGAAVLALTACGGAPQSSSSNDTLDASAPSDAGAPLDASAPLDAEAAAPDAATSDALDDARTPDDAAASCGPGGVATMPSPYGMPWETFPSDNKGFTMELNGAFPGDTYSRFIAAFDLPGGTYRSLLTLVGSDTVGETMLGDATNVYFFDAGGSAGTAVGIYSLARAGGSPPVRIVAIDPTGYLGFELGPSDVWFQQLDSSTGRTSFYSVPKSGGPLGSPVYTAAPDRLIEGIYVGASTIYWAERSTTQLYAEDEVTIYSSPALATLAPTPLTTFTAGGELGVLANNGTVYFAILNLIPPPTPPPSSPPSPPGPSGGDAGSSGNDAGDAGSPGDDAGPSPPTLQAGLYSLGSDGAATLIDSNGAPPLFAAQDGVFYHADTALKRFDATAGAALTYPTTVPWQSFSVADGTTLLYAGVGGCVYEAVAPPK